MLLTGVVENRPSGTTCSSVTPAPRRQLCNHSAPPPFHPSTLPLKTPRAAADQGWKPVWKEKLQLREHTVHARRRSGPGNSIDSYNPGVGGRIRIRATPATVSDPLPAFAGKNTPRRERIPLSRRPANAGRSFKGQRATEMNMWFGLDLLRLICLSVSVPLLLGVPLGLWIDQHYPSPAS
jgi:predicted F0F1-ATPase subunit